MPDPAAATTRVLSFAGAITEAITQVMEIDPSVLVMGVGIDDPQPTRGSTGLVEKFGSARVIGTPLSEDGMTGVAIGLALGGYRPLQIHGRIDFAMLSMNQLVNVAAKLRGMYGGALGGVPVVVRGTIGRSWGQGGQHSQGLQSLFAHIPGLRVVMPSTPADAKSVMVWALTENKDPLVIIDHRMLHRLIGHVPLEAEALGPDASLGSAAESSSLTLVALSYMMVEAERAAAHLKAAFGFKIDVIDPLWIRPLSRLSTIVDSVAMSQRLLVVDCGWPSFGVSAEIVAGVAERAVFTKVARMGFAETVCPTAKSLEALYYPNAATIAARAFEMITGKEMPAWDARDAAPEVAGFRGPF